MAMNVMADHAHLHRKIRHRRKHRAIHSTELQSVAGNLRVATGCLIAKFAGILDCLSLSVSSTVTFAPGAILTPLASNLFPAAGDRCCGVLSRLSDAPPRPFPRLP